MRKGTRRAISSGRSTAKKLLCRSVDRVVRDRSLGDDFSLLHSEASLGHARGALGDHLHTVLLGLNLLGVVSLDTVEELLTATGGGDMLDTNMHALGHDAATDLLVHDHTNGMGGDVEHTASASVVELVRHTRLDGGVGLDVDVVAKLVVDEVGRQVRHATLAERAREHVAGAAAVTLGLRHLETMGSDTRSPC